MELANLEQILSKNGYEWSDDELRLVFHEFFEVGKFGKTVAAYIKRMFSPNEQEDVIQEFYLQILKGIKNYDVNRIEDSNPINKFTAFLRRNLRDCCLSYYRKHGRQWRLFNSLDETVSDETAVTFADLIESKNISPEKEASLNEMIKIVNECLQQLSPLQREVFYLRYFEGLTNKEILKMGIAKSDGALRINLFRAKTGMMKLLNERGINYFELIGETEDDN